MEQDLLKSSRFFIDQRIWFSLQSSEVRALIEVAILNFLKPLTAPNPVVSNLALVCLFLDLQACEGLTTNLMTTGSIKGFLSEVSSIYSIALCLHKIFHESTGCKTFHKRYSLYVVALLQCTRHSLGIMASSKVTIVGRFLLEVQLWNFLF
ncbi:hypothetical protein ZIOFF_072277 [Zingiber officinale]|uniref:Uncharacterized protein n=1 Tax=Zingiber officinale TaxID=94328 RepID=A0A8J5BFI1_ZINOF|nr:hypothetical protein ZIOFF_072277 [Zingiber officinale]